jgi:hypothetical protein
MDSDSKKRGKLGLLQAQALGKTHCCISVHMLAVLLVDQTKDCRDCRDAIANDPVVEVETPQLFSIESKEEDQHDVDCSSAYPVRIGLHEPLCIVSALL